jgi:enamine deaminase RidA (YjgF/YER057c/UK114 family)
MGAMTLELINPDGLPAPESYTHIACATGSRMIFVAGQLSEDAEGKLVGAATSLRRPARRSRTSGTASPPPAHGPTRWPRSRSTSAGHRPAYLPDISAARIAVFGDHKPPDTLLGVETLFEPGYLIEVDAVAVVD